MILLNNASCSYDDLLDKLIEEHIDELRRLCKEASNLDFIESNVLWFNYFEIHYSFFSAMLLSKGAPFFRNRLLERNL